MINLKPMVVAALKNNLELKQLIGDGERIHFHYPPNFNILPCISYREDENTGALFADDMEVGSKIGFVIDVWGKQSLSAICQAVDFLMTELGFVRIDAPDLYENDTKIHHKPMQYETLAD
jgi:hypothetical protein